MSDKLGHTEAFTIWHRPFQQFIKKKKNNQIYRFLLLKAEDDAQLHANFELNVRQLAQFH